MLLDYFDIIYILKNLNSIKFFSIDFIKLYKGEASVVQNEGKSNEKIVKLKQGASFGEVSLISNVKRTANVYAETFCTVLVLQKKDYEEIIEYN